MKSRNANIEVLRCFLMFYIVLGHCTFGLFENLPVSRVIDSSMCFSVNAFVFISGWYSIKFSWNRVAKFLFQGVYAALLVWGASFFTMDPAQFRFSFGWFGTGYLGLMVAAPFLNAAVEGLRARSERILFSAWLPYFFLIFISWLELQDVNVVIRPNGWGGHTFNTMMFMYITGRMMSGWKCEDRWSCASLLVAGIILEILVIGWLTIGFGLKDARGLSWIYAIKASDYQSPFMIALSVTAFMLFLKIKINEPIRRGCCLIAPSMFMVYLLHNAMNVKAVQPMVSGMKQMLSAGQQDWWTVFWATFVTAVVVFVGSVCADIPRRLIMKLWPKG